MSTCTTPYVVLLQIPVMNVGEGHASFSPLQGFTVGRCKLTLA